MFPNQLDDSEATIADAVEVTSLLSEFDDPDHDPADEDFYSAQQLVFNNVARSPGPTDDMMIVDRQHNSFTGHLRPCY